MTKPIKMLCIGETGSGKTGALASLLDAGFNVRILDLDNGAEALINLITDPKSRYKKDSISRLSYITITEPMRVMQGRIVPAKATVWNRAVASIENWKSETPTKQELGPISKWTDQDILVVDTLGTLGTAAQNFHLMMNGELGKPRTQNEWRRDIGSAQSLLDTFLQLIFDESIKCNVIINTHIVYAKEDGTLPKPDEADSRLFGFPSAIGRALSPKIGKYFNHLLMIRREGESRRLWTKSPLGNVNLKSGAPLKVKDSYDITTGLAEYFTAIRNP